MLFRVYWKYNDSLHNGFVRSSNSETATIIAKKKLNPECVVTDIFNASEHQITPQSVTLNFFNESKYEVFG